LPENRQFFSKGVLVRVCRSALLAIVGLALCVTAGVASAADPVKVKFEAVIIQGAKALKDDIKWSVAPIGSSEQKPQQVTKASPEMSLLPGRYRVQATLGLSTISKDIVVEKAGKQTFDFNSGYARFNMIPQRGSKPIEENIHWQLFRYTKGGIDERHKLADFVAPSPQVTLPEGWYSIRGQYDGVLADTVIEVKAGILYKYTVVAYAGKVGLSAVTSKGKAVKDKVTWTIQRATLDKNGKRQTIHTDVKAAPTVLLREGKYVVTAQSGELYGEAPLEIAVGKTKKLKVEMKQGKATADAGS
jgi:hypothetical protein